MNIGILCHCNKYSEHKPLYITVNNSSTILLDDLHKYKITYIDPYVGCNNISDVSPNSLDLLWLVYCPVRELFMPIKDKYKFKLVTDLYIDGYSTLKDGGKIYIPISEINSDLNSLSNFKRHLDKYNRIYKRHGSPFILEYRLCKKEDINVNIFLEGEDNNFKFIIELTKMKYKRSLRKRISRKKVSKNKNQKK